jgi:HK97 family phage prohead protease
MGKKFDRQLFSSRLTFALADPAVAQLKIVRSTFADGNATVTVSGYPIVWGAKSSDRGGYNVRLAPNSAIFSTPTLALWHHDFSKPLAGTANQTLRIGQADSVGVPVEMDFDMNTTACKDAYAYVSSKLVAGMSFSMVDEDGYSTITVNKFTADEVTITPIPAFTETSIAPKPDDPDPDGTPPVAGGMSQATPERVAAAMRLRQERLYLLKG